MTIVAKIRIKGLGLGSSECTSKFKPVHSVGLSLERLGFRASVGMVE